MITQFKDSNHKVGKNCMNYETVTSVLESVDTTVFSSPTTTSVTLSVTSFELTVVSILLGGCIPFLI